MPPKTKGTPCHVTENEEQKTSTFSIKVPPFNRTGETLVTADEERRTDRGGQGRSPKRDISIRWGSRKPEVLKTPVCYKTSDGSC